MMDHNHRSRTVGDYEFGEILGSGSFSIVWKSKHKKTGKEVAIKEIKKTTLNNPKISDYLFKEISVLDKINHPNIIRLYETIETEERIYIVLEYCDGGDLGAYINRHGKVSEDVARYFIGQLAAGLQVLQENHLIHRDLKPQNLLLSSNEEYPQLKIGDFGFVRTLSSHDLAATLCGSPLYMAPEIIQRLKYDAKADLWSVGAILFQLVTGKTPFTGNCQYQLFQNILSSTELEFPEGVLEQLHPDCVDLCRNLLRRNPDERLTFKEFFNHKFLVEARIKEDFELSSQLPHNKSGAEHVESSTSNRVTTISEYPESSAFRTSLTEPSVPSLILGGTDLGSHDIRNVHGSISKLTHDGDVKPDVQRVLVDHFKVVCSGGDAVDPIEKDYVIVNRHHASEDNFSFCTEKSLEDSIDPRVSSRVSSCLPIKSNTDAAATSKTEKNPEVDGLNQSSASSPLPEPEKVEISSMLSPSTRLQLLHQYVLEVAELAQEKHNAGQLLESFSVELVVLAIWKNIHNLWKSWLASVEDSTVSETLKLDSGSSLCDFLGVERGFALAFERAEKLSHHLRETDATAELPDGMELIFRKALDVGTTGAVHEYMMDKTRAAAAYSKAVLLLSFLMNESTALPLSPPFSLTPATRNRIQNYINMMQSRQSHLNISGV